MPWRPFDTAPKFPKKDDKGPLILVHGVRGFTLAYWQYGRVPDGGWWVDLMVCPAVLKGATHWMELPMGPETEEKEKTHG